MCDYFKGSQVRNLGIILHSTVIVQTRMAERGSHFPMAAIDQKLAATVLASSVAAFIDLSLSSWEARVGSTSMV